MQLFVDGGCDGLVVVFSGVALASAARFALHPAHGRGARSGLRALLVALVSVAGLRDLAAVRLRPRS
jgi:hypothetical protein